MIDHVTKVQARGDLGEIVTIGALNWAQGFFYFFLEFSFNQHTHASCCYNLLLNILSYFSFNNLPIPVAQWLRDREVVGWNPGGAIPKALKKVPCLVLSIIRQALASLLPTNVAPLNFAALTKNKKV